MLNAAFLCLLAAAFAGAASTLLELSWLRTAAAVLPGTVPAAAFVVPVFFGAWTAGAAVGGRLMDRSSATLGLAARWLAASAAAVVAVPWLASALEPDGVPVSLVTRLLVGGLPVVPAAFGLGGALPLLARLRAATDLPPERATGAVAVAVALGGAAGCLAWVPLMTDGQDPLRVAAVALAAGALLCWLLEAARRGGLVVAGARLTGASAGDARPATAAGASVARASDGWLLAGAAAVGGLLLVSGQLAALRLAAQIHGDSVVTTAEIVGGVHVGMAAGAALLWFSWRPLPAASLVALLLVVAAAGLLLPARVELLVGARPGWQTAALLTVPLGLGAGSIVTAASRAGVRPPGRLGTWVGDLAAWSTLGGVAGSLLYGALLPRPEVGTGGLLRALWLVALAAALLLAAVATLRGRSRAAGPAALAAGRGTASAAGRAPGASSRLAALAVLVLAAASLALAWSTPAVVLPWRFDPSESRLLEQREGPYGVVSLVATDAGEIRLKLDNRFGLGGSSGVLLEQRLGRLAAALAPRAERALALGLGRGHTLAGLASSTRARVDCVERNAQILELGLDVPFLGARPAAGLPAIHHADARAWIEEHRGEYDLVVGDLFFPWVTGAGELLTVEHFEAVAAALTEGGVFVQWLPLHQLPWPAFGSVAAAFLEVFPTARLFVATPLASQPLVALVGGLVDGLPEPEALDELLVALPSPAGPAVAGDVYDLYLADAWTLTTAFRDEPSNRRRAPVSELASLRRQDDEQSIAATNLRLLADLVVPLDTSSLARSPGGSRERRELGVELAARSAVLRHLLLARALVAELSAADGTGAAPGSPWSGERLRLEENLTANLVEAWRRFPGHGGVRVALLERSRALSEARRWDDAGALLKPCLEIQGDGPLGGVLGGVLVQLGLAPDAVRLLEAARALAPRDRTVLANLAFALLVTGADERALALLAEAREVFAPDPLPPAHAAALALLTAQPEGGTAARALLDVLEPDGPWAEVLARLLGEREG